MFNLKADDVFMGHCRENETFRDWVLREKPLMATEPKHKIKFLGLGHKPVEKPAEPTKKVIIEPVEEISKTAQIIKDLKEFRKTKNFL